MKKQNHREDYHDYIATLRLASRNPDVRRADILQAEIGRRMIDIGKSLVNVSHGTLDNSLRAINWHLTKCQLDLRDLIRMRDAQFEKAIQKFFGKSKVAKNGEKKKQNPHRNKA